MNLGRWIMVGVACFSGISRGDTPSIEGRIALGVRTSSIRDQSYVTVWDESSSLRVAADGLVGLRFGRLVAGLHAGIATPLRFDSEYYVGEGETYADTRSTIYPLDLGLGVQLDAEAGVWVSAWLGATVAFTDASSPAAHLNNIEFFGDVPAVSWSYHTTSLGYGVALGYDIVRNKHGRFAAVVAVESQGIGAIPFREADGTIAKGAHETCQSFTLGAAYSY